MTRTSNVRAVAALAGATLALIPLTAVAAQPNRDVRVDGGGLGWNLLVSRV